MHRFYIDEQNHNENICLVTGEDVDHLKKVLRLSVGDEVTLSNGEGKDYICKIADMDSKSCVKCQVIEEKETQAELPINIVLYQGLPKKDKMELIIQKTVELGVTEIVPVSMKRCIVKIEDDKLEAKKNARWTEIARAAGKQSGRGIIPEIRRVISYNEALNEAFSKESSYVLVPYENAEGMLSLKRFMNELKDKVNSSQGIKPTVSVFIGPEGGFEENEINLAKEKGATIVSLGHRILRTETAGLTTVALLMYEMETR